MGLALPAVGRSKCPKLNALERLQTRRALPPVVRCERNDMNASELLRIGFPVLLTLFGAPLYNQFGPSGQGREAVKAVFPGVSCRHRPGSFLTDRERQRLSEIRTRASALGGDPRPYWRL